MRILGIETSCDETAAAIVENGTDVLSNVLASSADLHAVTGGVVPEVAAREHLRQISPVIDKAMQEAKTSWKKIDAIAVTYAPGLIASLLVGWNTAQTLAYLHQKPLIPVHHIAGHIYANFLERKEPIQFPILVLTVSGGHNELVLMKGHHQFQVLGETLDDAAGEAFDKVARLLGLGYPGGPAIAKLAERGNSQAYDFPRSMLDPKNRYNFSFSGVKTAVWRVVQVLRQHATHSHSECHFCHSEGVARGISPITHSFDRMIGEISHCPVLSRTGQGVRNDRGVSGDDKRAGRDDIADIAASFQAAVVDVLTDKLVAAAQEFDVREVHLAGGVSANQKLRQIVRERLSAAAGLPQNLPLFYPHKLSYCTDNAAMIAGAAYFLKKVSKVKGVLANCPLS